MARVITKTVQTEYDGIKVYTYLKQILHLSTASVRKLKHTQNGITRNGEYVRTVDFLSAGDTLCLSFPEEKNEIPPTNYDFLDIQYADDDILVINKPAGVAMHPTHNHQGDTLANQVTAYLQDNGMSCPFRAIGRLDKCTSGLVICALNRHASSVLSGNYKKVYLALAGGVITGKGTVDKPIIRPDAGKTLRAVGENGEKAVTHYESLGTNGKYSLLRLSLDTGRTHQIRVHCQSMNAPLLGDEMYGGDTSLIQRAALHCAELDFTHPISGERMHFTVPLPDDMAILAEPLLPK